MPGDSNPEPTVSNQVVQPLDPFSFLPIPFPVSSTTLVGKQMFLPYSSQLCDYCGFTFMLYLFYSWVLSPRSGRKLPSRLNKS